MATNSFLPPTTPPHTSGAKFLPSPAPAVSRRGYGSNRRSILRSLKVLTSPEVTDVDSFTDCVAGTRVVDAGDERHLASSCFSFASAGEWDIAAAFSHCAGAAAFSDCAGAAPAGCGDPALYEFPSSAAGCGDSAFFEYSSFAASPGRPAFPAFSAGIDLASDYSFAAVVGIVSASAVAGFDFAAVSVAVELCFDRGCGGGCDCRRDCSCGGCYHLLLFEEEEEEV